MLASYPLSICYCIILAVMCHAVTVSHSLSCVNLLLCRTCCHVSFCHCITLAVMCHAVTVSHSLSCVNLLLCCTSCHVSFCHCITLGVILLLYHNCYHMSICYCITLAILCHSTMIKYVNSIVDNAAGRKRGKR